MMRSPPKPFAVPPELARTLAKSPAARAKWDALAHTHKREYATWIAEAKKAETRERRLEKALLLLLEGQKTPMRANDAPAVSKAPLTKKLGVKDGVRFVVLSAPSGHAIATASAGSRGKGAVVLAFAQDSKALAKVWPKAHASLDDGGLLWLAYPKKTSGLKTDLARDEGWTTVRDAGWQTVMVVSIDDAWSAVRVKRI